ncbi:hypothetical protein [Bdellovibrio sp. HCB2-146]|uniref:hypothetical protein n=1 Tax=Bdellovibrio sp. HCB2-146 TaxID=3394362 RepID=UPI0039BD85A0
MRFGFVMSTLLLATLSHAQTTEPAAAPSETPAESIGRIQERNMVDLGYLLPQGRLALNAYANVYTEAYEIKQNSTPDSKVASIGNRVGIELSYGIFDSLNIAAGVSYVPMRKTEEQITDLSAESRGWEEPTVGLQYRVLTQSESAPFDIVLGLNYSPKTEDLKYATFTSDGTPARGGDKTSFDLGFYRRTSTGELALVLNHVSLGKTEGKSASGLTEITGKATGTTSVMGTGQFPFNDKVFVRGGLGATHNQETETTSATVSSIESYGTLDFLAGMRIVVIPDRAMVDLAISAQAPVKTDIEVNEGGTIKEMTSAARANFLAGVKFLY